jgi:hypothetical protein
MSWCQNEARWSVLPEQVRGIMPFGLCEDHLILLLAQPDGDVPGDIFIYCNEHITL